MTDDQQPGVPQPGPAVPAPGAGLLDAALPGTGLPGTAPPIRDLDLRFTGSAGEYFRIWIVNVALGIVTLGLYTPWARVRTRSYFYGHTLLEGEAFSYTANPWALFRGYLLVGALFGLFSLLQSFPDLTWLRGVLALIFVGLYPYLIYRSLRFNAANTVYRGLSFHFLGRPGGAYVAYLLILLTLPVTLGLTYPLVLWMQRRYLIEQLAYGITPTRWGRDVGPVYLYFLWTVLGVLGVGLVVGLLAGAVWLTLRATGGADFTGNPFDRSSGPGLVVLAGLGYVLYLALLLGSGHYLRAALISYSLHGLYLGQTLRLQNSIRPLQLAWIEVSNIVAQLFTLGLLTPWAAVRRTRYILSHVAVQTVGSLDDFHAAATPGESALGEAANEFFNFDIGF